MSDFMSDFLVLSEQKLENYKNMQQKIAELTDRVKILEQTVRYESDLCQQALDSRKEMESQLEDAQGENRALRATEAGLRERVKELEDAVRDAAVLADFAECWITDPAIEGMRRLEGGGEKFRALLEKQQ